MEKDLILEINNFGSIEKTNIKLGKLILSLGKMLLEKVLVVNYSIVF
ncbi:MAG: hypothetical protein LBT66_06730 [Methanobrevibacter sp.]|jgi:hypothetical protein|nr:hypothetical protein [Candidatus Methanovirga meridionalis]